MYSIAYFKLSVVHSFAVVFIVSLVLASSGCGSSNIPVTGEVTYQAKPLPNVKVILFGKKGVISQGTSDESGKFTISTAGLNDGAPEGDYRVAVLPAQTQNISSNTFDLSTPANTADKTIPPKKFHNPDTSGLTCTIGPGKGPLTIELKE